MKAKRQRQRQALKTKKRDARRQLQTPRRLLAAKAAKSPKLGAVDTKGDRVQIQFRIGKALINKIDHAASKKGVSRNDWLIKAMTDHLKNGDAKGSFNSEEASANREPILFRVGARVRGEIDKVIAQKGIANRTLWILDAILAALEHVDFTDMDTE